MKCPKCGYHSFDYLSSCKKCNSDLTAFKSKFNLRSLIFPKRPLPAQLASELRGEEAVVPSVATVATAASVAAATDFGFDFMDGESPTREVQPAATASAEEDNAFSWDEAEGLELTEKPGTAHTDAEELDWDEAPTADAPAEEDLAAEEGAQDDSFGLDLSWDSDLPALEEEDLEGEEIFTPVASEGLPDWDFDDEVPPEKTEALPKQETEEEPSNPFELGGPGADAPVPAPAAAAGAVTEEKILPHPEEQPSLPVEQTSPLARLLALGFDLLVLSLAIFLFLIAGEAALAPAETRRLLPDLATLLALAIPYFLVLFAVCFGYFTLFHFLTGQTPGKMLLRLRVETELGAPLAFSQAFLRSTGGLFSLLCFGLGFLTILFDPRRRGWNDRLAGTLVVTVKPALGGTPTD